MAALGWQEHNLPMVAVWVACGFLSILVHEYGHGLMSTTFGCSPSILLFGMGGLCYSQGERQSLGQRLAVVLSGPAAGLGLFLLVMCACSAFFGLTAAEHLSVSQDLLGSPHAGKTYTRRLLNFRGIHGTAFQTYWFLIQINLFWSLFNLLPIWPLDGGQATQLVLSLYDRSRGPRWATSFHSLSPADWPSSRLAQGNGNLFRPFSWGTSL